MTTITRVRTQAELKITELIADQLRHLLLGEGDPELRTWFATIVADEVGINVTILPGEPQERADTLGDEWIYSTWLAAAWKDLDEGKSLEHMWKTGVDWSSLSDSCIATADAQAERLARDLLAP